MDLEESANYLLINQGRLAERFYQLLFEQHPETKPFFDGIDMSAQQDKLVAALVTVQRHATVGGWVSENYLRGLGKMHVDLGVKPEMFAGFVDTLITALAELHADDWSSRLQADWRNALSASLELILTAYAEESG